MITQYRYNQIGILTREMTDKQREALAQLIIDDERVTAIDIAYVLADQARLSIDGPSPSLLMHRIRKLLGEGATAVDAPTEPLADEQVETVRTVYRDDTIFLQCCKVRRWVGHKADCPEAN